MTNQTVALLNCLDAIQVHALAAAAVIDSKFVDVAVRFPAARGRTVDVFYGGQRPSNYFGPGSLSSQHVAESIYVRAHWPVAETGKAKQRAMEGEMAVFSYELRGRLDNDFTLGGNCTVLKVLDQVDVGIEVEAKTKYAHVTHEIGLDLGEYPYAP